MAGGTFITQNKIRPGAYINFGSNSTVGISIKDRGVVALPIEIPFGPVGNVVAINADSDFFAIFGVGINHSALFLVKEAFKRAKTVLLYRLAGGSFAKISSNGLKITAKTPGTFANGISVRINNAIHSNGEAGFKITTLLSDKIFHEQIILANDLPTDNDIITIEKTGDLSETTGIFLVGGSDNAVVADDYSKFFRDIALYEFNALAITSTDDNIIDAAVSFIKRMREHEGKKCILVAANIKNPDYEGVINVCNGVVLSDNTVLPANLSVSWVAAASAAANINESLTFDRYDGAIDANPRFSNSETIKKIENGEFLFTSKNGTAVIEQDINSFISFDALKGKFFAKNRVIRVIDAIANDISDVFEKRYIGKISNNDIGRSLFKNECIGYLNELAMIGAISDFDAKNDITVVRGNDIENIVVNAYIRPIDSVEKLYMSVILS